MKRLLTIVTALALGLVFVGCTHKQTKYVIGISQCSEDIWRDKQNAELRMGAYFHDGVELKFAAAYDSDERQVQQIDSLVNSGIDLLVVAPNQVQTISPAIDRAYDKGIPVIVFERKTSSEKFTAFISADNYEMGRVMGEYIVARLHGQGNVMEIKGLEGSSPSIERHNGFMDAIKQAPGIQVVASLQGRLDGTYSLRNHPTMACQSSRYTHRSRVWCQRPHGHGRPKSFLAPRPSLHAPILRHRRPSWRERRHPTGTRFAARRLVHLSHSWRPDHRFGHPYS
jgi:ABC-type sugar transport system substrate-binding protein